MREPSWRYSTASFTVMLLTTQQQEDSKFECSSLLLLSWLMLHRHMACSNKLGCRVTEVNVKCSKCTAAGVTLQNAAAYTEAAIAGTNPVSMCL